MTLASRIPVLSALQNERARLRRLSTALAVARSVSRGTPHDEAQCERIAADVNRCSGRVVALEADLLNTPSD